MQNACGPCLGVLALISSTRQDTHAHKHCHPCAGGLCDALGLAPPLLCWQLPAANQISLQRAWNVEQLATTEDWEHWMRRFSVSLLRESPSAALRACSTLAQVTMVSAVVIWMGTRLDVGGNLAGCSMRQFAEDRCPLRLMQQARY